MAFLRAVSPAVASIAAVMESSVDSAKLARHSAMLAANSFDELMTMIPHDYRVVLRPPLALVSSHAEKRAKMKVALAKLRDHRGRDPVTFPPSISVKAHDVQLTKEYAVTEEGKKQFEALRKASHDYRVALLDAEISAKEKNVAHLDGLLQPSSIYMALSEVIKARFEILKLTQKSPILEQADAADGMEDGEINLVVKGWEVSPVTLETFRNILQDAAAFAFRVIALVEARDIAAQVKLEKKKELRNAADVEMADATKPGPSMQSMIDKAVSAAWKKSAPSVSGRLKTGYSQLTYQTTETKRQGLVVETSEQPYRGDRRAPSYRLGSSLSSKADPVSAKEECQGHSQRRPQERRSSRIAEVRLHQEGQSERRRTQSRLSTQQERTWRGEGQEHISPVDFESAGSELSTGGTLQPFRYDVPSSYPDRLLTIPLPNAINYIILNTPVNIVLASQFKDSIHCSPGVEIPREIELQLSVGMRFMFRSNRNTQLIIDAWNDFERRIRWRLFFSFQGADDGLYDPDFEVRRKSTKQPPKLPLYLEMGLRLGRNFVKRTISKIPDEDRKDDTYRSLNPSPSSIKKFLLANDYVVTNTDKNLGIAVSKREWVEDKCLQLLEDKSNYMLLHPLTAAATLAKQCMLAFNVATLAEDHLDNGKQIGEFLRSTITPFRWKKDNSATMEFLEQHNVPLFYGIPKIHKLPVKMRPIIPCHSAIQNPAAKYVSKKLKPLIKAAPTIIHGTKDLAIKLSKLELNHHRKYYIVTGDVVAYYPSIPIEHCLDIVALQYREHYGDGVALNNAELMREEDIFLKCLRLGNTNLITRFNDKMFLQTRGLAMGVADSPDLANLYGWHFEKQLNIINDPDVPLYGRYIDDCLAIVYASSEQQAIDIVSQVKFDECVIEWNASASQPFLDMTLYIDEYNKLQHMPYRKARSHQERVPWISYHPLDVKRGTFIGEMSRLATLCSQFLHYKDAMQALAGLYIKRGYPNDLVYSWMRDNIAERWKKRLDESREGERQHADVLVLKSEFNTAWNYFSARELGDTVLGYWRTYLQQADTNELQGGMFTKYDSTWGSLDSISDELTSELPTTNGVKPMPDIRKLDILNRRMIVSRKRTRNLFDLTSLWKKTVLQTLDDDALSHDTNDVPEPHESDSDWESEDDRLQEGDLEYVAVPMNRRSARGY